jgi:serine/threonine-protein kinase
LPVCIRCKSVVVDDARFCPHCGTAQAFPRLPSKVDSGSALTLEDWGKVVVGDVIGEGGMGVVHRGWLYYDPAGRYTGTPAHPVAVKVLNPLLRGRERARQLFLREAQALARLSHPNVVHFFGLVQEDGQLALVIELVDGESMSALIQRHARALHAGAIPCMPFLMSWHYFSQLLGALAAIHALGIIHRDVKPGNLLVRADGVVKLTDFGIARVPADEARSTGGMAPGTGAYMSPEQVRGSELDSRADLYSAAIVLYEMLTSTTPFDSPERNELMVRTAQLDEAPPPLTRFIPQAPPVLDLLFARALAKDPMHRFASAVEMGEAFRTALGLPETPGWQAQQRLAKNAQAISQIGMAAAQAEQLRTDVMQAYRQG